MNEWMNVKAISHNFFDNLNLPKCDQECYIHTIENTHWNDWKQHFLGKRSNFGNFLMKIPGENANEWGYKMLCTRQNPTSIYSSYIRPLIQQGKMLEFIYLEQSDLTWHSIIHNRPRGVVSFAVRSSIDFLPTLSNLKCWGKKTNARCPLCKNNETLCHVLNNCSVSLNQGWYTWRHDSILRHIVQLLQAPSTKSDVKMHADIDGMTSSGGTILADILPTSQRPDLFLYDEKAKKAIIAELTVPFEPNIPKAHKIKQSRMLVSFLIWIGRVSIPVLSVLKLARGV